jgi:hypothetical protein
MTDYKHTCKPAPSAAIFGRAVVDGAEKLFGIGV